MNNMKRHAIIISFLLSLLISVAEGADWKLYAKNAPLERGIIGNAYYDRDSIAYPFETKGFFSMKKDKSIISIWTKYTFPQQDRELNVLCYLYCQKRQISLKSIIRNGHYIYPPSLGHTFGIEPNTTDEQLYKSVCR